MHSYTINKITTHDARYTLPAGAGTDAVHTNPEYCMAVTLLESDHNLNGTGIALTLGEGNRLVCEAIEMLARPLAGMEIEALKTFIPGEKRAVYILGELHNYERDLPLMENLFHSHGWKLNFYEIYDNLAQFRACSPAAWRASP